MVNKQSRSEIRVKKHRRLRHHLVGTAQRPRLSVFRSNNHIYAQIIDDTVGNTLVAASTMEKAIKDELQYTDNVAVSPHCDLLLLLKRLLKKVLQKLSSIEADLFIRVRFRL